jgi:hypothetical protein
MEFVRCRLTWKDGHYTAHSTGTQSSGVLSSLSLGEELMIGPADFPLLPKGMYVKVLVFGGGYLVRLSRRPAGVFQREVNILMIGSVSRIFFLNNQSLPV